MMMQTPGLDSGDCPNYRTCGSGGSVDEELEFVWGVNQERIRLTRSEAAVLMLTRRGNPQSPESLGVVELVEEIESLLEAVKQRLTQFENVYVAPEQVETHRYNVKRRGKVFLYNKLASREAIFEPSERSQRVRAIHLSHDDDSRNLEARAGIQRRNQLTQARTKLREIQSRLAEALDLLE